MFREVELRRSFPIGLIVGHGAGDYLMNVGSGAGRLGAGKSGRYKQCEERNP
jgi:hypothetical protein